MNRDTFKYVGLGIIGIVLITANVRMVYSVFFSKSRLYPDIKKVVILTDDQIKHYAESLFVHKDSLQIKEDEIENNKRIIFDKNDTIGFVYIIDEKIPCPSCSNVNYLLMTDKEYTIKNIVFMKEIIEDYKFVPVDTFKLFSNNFLYRNILKDDFKNIKTLKNPQKHSIYFSESILKIQKQVKLFYDN